MKGLPDSYVGPAVEFYRSVVGFTVVSQDDERATVQRNNARLGLVKKPDHNPGEAGPCAFAVTDLDAMCRELENRGLDLGGIHTREWDGKRYCVFFLREAENGYCYCFSQPA